MSSINCKIQRKLSVFISSRMSGRYDFIRRELAFLLINTDLFDVFIYEDSGAGSENNIDSYIEELKRSDAVIFMVDNKDDVSDAVLKEERTAKENGLRRIYIFCNQDSKEHTQMQESLKDKYGAKYEETPSFREMPERAYLSILQDIISIYRRKTPPHSSGDDILPRLPDTPSSPEPAKYPSAPKCLADYLAGFQVQDIDCSDVKAMAFLEVVIRRKSFAENFTRESFMKYAETLITGRENISDFLKLRFEAVCNFYQGSIEAATESERKALSEGMNNASVPDWMIMDTAIDLRNMARSIKSYELIGQAQECINQRGRVHYPILDRFDDSISKYMLEDYEAKFTMSPYTIRLGSNFYDIIKSIADIFWLSLHNGSFSHIELTRRRMTNMLTMINNIYDDHQSKAELIRLLCLDGGDMKKLDSFMRTYHSDTDMLSPEEASEILRCIRLIPDADYARARLFGFMAKFGYYCTDTEFEHTAEELAREAMLWAEHGGRDYDSSENIFRFYGGTWRRNRANETLDFAVTALEHLRNPVYYEHILDLLRAFDFREASPERVRNIIGLLAGDAGHPKVQDIIANIGILCPEMRGMISSGLENTAPEFLRENYAWSLYVHEHRILPEDYITSIIDIVSIRNQEALQGTYISSRPLDPIKRFIWDGVNITDKDRKRVIDCLAETLSNPVQDIDMKICSCEILTLLGEDAVKSIPDNQEAYCSGHPDMLKKSLPVMLEYAYVLMMSLCRSNTSEATELLFMNPDYEDSTIIKLLSISLNFLRSKHSDSMADVIMAFVLSSTVRYEKDIHFLAVLCLLELTKNMKYRHTALKKLAAYMDCGQAEIRANIVSGVAYIKDKQTEYIMQKAYTDNNYLVRRSALAEKGDK